MKKVFKVNRVPVVPMSHRPCVITCQLTLIKSKLTKLRAHNRFFFLLCTSHLSKNNIFIKDSGCVGAELLPSAPHDSAPAPSSCCSTPSPSPRSPPARSSPRPPSPTYSRTPSCWASTGSSRRGPRCRGSPRSPRRSPHRSCPPSGSVWPASGSFSPRSVR